MTEDAVSCLVCGARRVRERPFGYRFNTRWLGGYECVECGIIFIHPQPSSAEIAQLYSKEYFEGDFRCGYEGSYFDDRTLAAVVDRQLLERIGRVKPSGRFLEIGCAGGAFLDAARGRGYDVHGVEFSDDAARFARERFNLQVETGDVRDAKLDAASYDVVFMGDVIEHLPHPVATMNEIHRVMARGGLLVLECPSQTHTLFSRFGFSLYSLLGKKAVVALPPYHLFEYRPSSLRFLLKRCAFDVLRVTESMIPPGRVTLRGSFAQKVGKKVIQYPNYVVTKAFGVLGDRLEIFALKNTRGTD